MTDKKTFEISLIRKIPYLTNGLLIIFIVSAMIFLFFYAGASSKKATSEMKTFYLMHTSTIKLFYGSGFVTGLSMFLYFITRLRKKGVIVFNADSFELILRQEQSTIPFSLIRRVYCNDSETRKGNPNKRFTMTIETIKDKKIFVRLRNTGDIKQFIDKLLSCDNLTIEHYSFAGIE